MAVGGDGDAERRGDLEPAGAGEAGGGVGAGAGAGAGAEGCTGRLCGWEWRRLCMATMAAIAVSSGDVDSWAGSTWRRVRAIRIQWKVAKTS